MTPVPALQPRLRELSLRCHVSLFFLMLQMMMINYLTKASFLIGKLTNVKVYVGNIDHMDWSPCKTRPYKGTIQPIWSYFKENSKHDLYRCMLCSMVMKIERHQNGNTVRTLKKHIAKSGSKYYRCSVGCDPNQPYIGGCSWENPEFKNLETLASNPSSKQMTPNDYIWYIMNSTNQPMSFADDRAVVGLSYKLKELIPTERQPACNSNNMKRLLEENVKDIDTLLLNEINRSNSVLSTPLIITHKQEFEQKCYAKIEQLSNIHFVSLVLDHWSDTRLRSFIGVIIVVWDKYKKIQRS